MVRNFDAGTGAVEGQARDFRGIAGLGRHLPGRGPQPAVTGVGDIFDHRSEAAAERPAGRQPGFGAAQLLCSGRLDLRCAACRVPDAYIVHPAVKITVPGPVAPADEVLGALNGPGQMHGAGLNGLAVFIQRRAALFIHGGRQVHPFSGLQYAPGGDMFLAGAAPDG